jgi:hypothetical protein
MQYFLGVVDANHELSGYKKEGRQVVLQNLKLTSDQKKQLVEKMIFLAKPENRYYHYDYFLNNCTSKIRDIVDEVTKGLISSQLTPIETNQSWNDLTFPVSNQAWLNFGLAFGYGINAYSHKNQWELSVFPEKYSNDMKDLDENKYLKSDYEVYYKPSENEWIKKQFFKTHYAIILMVGFLLLGLMFQKTRKLTKVTWLTIQNLLGFGLIFLWFFTQHSIAAWNINVLIFSPFAILMLFKTTNKFIHIPFLISNIVWIALALIFTNLYLIGFSLVNIMLWKNHKQA